MLPKTATCLAAVLAFSSWLPAQQSQTAIKMTQVAGPVYMLEGNGGNVGVVADPGGVVMIDAMEVPSAGEIREAIRSLPGGDHIRILINTHWHADHSDGNKALGRGAVIVAHENVRPLLAQEQTLLGGRIQALPPEALPNLTYGGRLTVFAGGDTIRLVHYPQAHTGGDTVVFADANKVVHMGDMFFNGMFPFLDVANGGDIDNWVRQLDALLASIPADAKIIPGHGPLASPPELKTFRQMLADSAEAVRSQIKAGKSLEQIQAAGLPERFAPWAQGFLTTPQWLELVYRSLTKQK